MRIQSVSIKNLRSIRTLKIEFEAVTALVGANNVGKSTILRALCLFFEPSPKVSQEDFLNREEPSIEIAIEFSNITPEEARDFGSAVVGGNMTVKRVISQDPEENLRYEVLAKSYRGFSTIRATTGKAEKRAEFNRVAQTIDGLDNARSADEAELKMAQWEQDHPDDLELLFSRDFFGAPNVACGKLRKKTSVHFVPAVVDAHEETSDKRRSPIISLLSEISRQTFENKKEVQDFIVQANQRFEELVDPANAPDLQDISKLLTESVGRFYKDSKLLADWNLSEGVSIEYPKPSIKVEDQGFETTLANVGHGLQRACLFSIIQFLAERNLSTDDGEEFEAAQSDIVLLIEEPEIYQHPHKQQIISDAFYDICKDFNRKSGIRFQIIFTTHSEKFADIRNFPSARIIRRSENADGAIHQATSVQLTDCSQYFADLLGRAKMPDDAFLAKMHIFSNELCEGFFANRVVLVEGVTDKAILEASFRLRGRSPITEGLAIIQVDGKTKLDKPLYVFSKLGIPTYPIFDSDEGKAPKKQNIGYNRLLQKMLTDELPVDFPTGCHASYCCIGGNLEAYLASALGEEHYNGIFEEMCEKFALTFDSICKTPLAITQVLQRAQALGIQFTLFDEIIMSVDALNVATVMRSPLNVENG
ncbi:AAA family ATPase [Histidinibacterium lentulum]|uniref:DUF2813 domain-containing protein n=1 Tax=Histidinibacterium lentulum TaxID=2480588 RepID=A0A3N2QR49_9RHOB|nr:AAA family ATPase [Histidinibacterium lentulum]ROT97673.1 DUF2813 domain-containing protein [Histidinibacterium lentulum]